jgi:hypothetical protein
MCAQKQYSYDVFISYSTADQIWVRDYLVPQLKQSGLRVFIDYNDFELGESRLNNIERGIKLSRKVLLVLTPRWVASNWTHFDALLAQMQDPAGYLRRMIPLLLEPCDLPDRISMLTYADFTQVDSQKSELERLLKALGTRARIFISYKRNAIPDDPLAKQLYSALEQAGHRVFIDHTIKVGVAWARELERQIDDSDFLVVLLSESSIHSEMVAKEVEYSYRRSQHTSKSRLLPVRVNYSDALPYSISPYLDHIQQATWQDDGDTERLIGQLLDAISHFEPLPEPPPLSGPVIVSGLASPRPAADLRFIESLREPGGAVHLGTEFYIQRKGDARLHSELSKSYGATITIRAPRQTGKSSLLIRGVAQARARGSKVVSIDLQPIDNSYLQSLDSFLHYFATFTFSKLGLDTSVIDKAWQSALSPSDKITYVMENYVLPQCDTKIILAIDEADRLLKTSFHDTFFGLIRFWHNNRAANELWDKLDILMVISTEPHLLIREITQSPFNVGLRIVLQDFDQNQVSDLNMRYQNPFSNQVLPDVMDFLNGHPYLTHRAMYTLMTEPMSWEQLKQIAASQHSPFGDHLRRYLWLLRDQRQLQNALKHIVTHRRCPDEMLFYRLLQAGLVKGDDNKECSYRCRLYEIFLKDKL